MKISQMILKPGRGRFEKEKKPGESEEQITKLKLLI